MATPEENKTPLNSTNHPSQKRVLLHQNRSAPTAISKSGLTPCRRVGLKRKSTPGIIFKSPLKDNNFRSSDQIIGPQTQIVMKNNLFSNTLKLSNQNKNESRTSIEKGAEGTQYSQKSDKPNFMNGTVEPHKKMSTPVLSRLGRVGACSLNKRLKLSSDKPSEHNAQCLNDSALNLPQLSEVLNKNYSGFLNLYNDPTADSEKGEERDPQKQEIILRMKSMFNQITELKQLLLNAKQHDISNLESLTEKWRNGCQQALLLLLDKLRDQGHEFDMPQLLLKTGIPGKLVNYDEDVQDFIT